MAKSKCVFFVVVFFFLILVFVLFLIPANHGLNKYHNVEKHAVVE